MVIERTHYYAKPDRAAEVLMTRRRASAVRERLGLPAGRIAVKTDPAAEGPDVAWECTFADAEAQARDLSARAASTEFEAVRATMGGLIVRFERLVLTSDSGDAADAARPAARELVPTEVRFRSGAHDLVGYVYGPEGTGPVPALVLNHGSTIQQGTTDVCRPGTAALFLRWGYAVLLVHRHGYGNSEGPAWREDVPAEFGTPEYDRALAARLEREADDVLAARAFLATHPRIAPARLGVIGSSFGGTVSLLAAARDGGFSCAVDFAGAAMNWERTPALRAAMLDAIRRISVPIQLIQAANDYSVGPTRELGAELTRLRKRHEARVFPAFGLTRDEGHGFFQHGSLEWEPAVRGFLDRWLHP